MVRILVVLKTVDFICEPVRFEGELSWAFTIYLLVKLS